MTLRHRAVRQCLSLSFYEVAARLSVGGALLQISCQACNLSVGRVESGGMGPTRHRNLTENHMIVRLPLVLPVAAVALGIFLALPPAFGDDMSKDSMSKSSTMSKDSMSKGNMSKGQMNKDTMSKDGMKKDNMSKDTMSK
jgi:pentapeptide MXKDX repeat protein